MTQAVLEQNRRVSDAVTAVKFGEAWNVAGLRLSAEPGSGCWPEAADC